VIPAGQVRVDLLPASDGHRCILWEDRHSVQTDKNARQYRRRGISLLSGVSTLSLALTGTSRACSAASEKGGHSAFLSRQGAMAPFVFPKQIAMSPFILCLP
jgi:hypothetical protein